MPKTGKCSPFLDKVRAIIRQKLSALIKRADLAVKSPLGAALGRIGRDRGQNAHNSTPETRSPDSK